MSDESLLVALNQNWEHLRHQEIQRQHQLYVYVLLFSASLTFMLNDYVALHLTLQQFWPVFLFLSIYSFIVSSSVAKWNLEFKNLFKNIQWLSEKLDLIWPMSTKRIEEISNPNLICENKESLLADSMCQGYVGLALPLQKRVNRNFETIVDVILLGTTAAFISGLFIYIINSTLSLSTIDISGFIFSLRLVAYPIGLSISFVVTWVNIKTRNNMKENTVKLLDVREPDDISLRYRNIKPFYLDVKKKHKYHK